MKMQMQTTRRTAEPAAGSSTTCNRHGAAERAKVPATAVRIRALVTLSFFSVLWGFGGFRSLWAAHGCGRVRRRAGNDRRPVEEGEKSAVWRVRGFEER